MSPEIIGGGRILWLSSVYDPNEGPIYVGSIKIEGRSFDQVQVFSRMTPGDIGAFRWYDIHFCVLGNVEGKSKILKTSPKTGFLSKREANWKGKDLAEQLNKDSELKTMLAEYGIWTSIGKSNITVCPDEKYGCARIVFRVSRDESKDAKLVASRSTEILKIAEKVSQHIRSILQH